VASTICLAVSSTSRQRSPVTIRTVGVGPFGERVAERLLRLIPASRIAAEDDIDDVFSAAPSAVAIATWRPAPALCERADELAYRYRVPWLAVIMEHPVIRVGPLVDPATGPCFRCYRRRRVQHDTQAMATAAVHAAYERDPVLGPAGYLPQHVRLAAGLAANMLLAAGLAPSERCTVSSNVVTVRLLRRGLSMNPVVACHDCDRCGTSPGPLGCLGSVVAHMPIVRAASDDDGSILVARAGT
jgi:bacteriocin biosynthesis cyclodehydratase domain-containing protein